MNVRRRDAASPSVHQRGALAGIEVLPFGFLIFVAGTLVIFNAWLAIDTKLATSSAAREAVRAVVESDAATAEAAAIERATEAFLAYGRAPTFTIDGPSYDGGRFGRCVRVVVTVIADVPAVRVPFLGGAGHRSMRSSASELVDPYRDGEQEGSCAE